MRYSVPVRVDASTLLPISFKEGESRAEAPIPRFPLSFEKDLSVPVKKRDLNRKGLVKRGKNFRRPSWEQAEIESKRKRPVVVLCSFDEQLELERYAEEDDLGDPSSPIANHLSSVTYDEVKEERCVCQRPYLYIHTQSHIFQRGAATEVYYAALRHRCAPRVILTHTISTGKSDSGAVAHGRIASAVACDPSSPSPKSCLLLIPCSLESSMGRPALYKTVGKRSHQAVGLRRQSS